MTLYEATNGMEGCAYVRCYVWACDQEEALKLARDAFLESGSQDIDIDLKALFSDDEPSFATRVSDVGWE